MYSSESTDVDDENDDDDEIVYGYGGIFGAKNDCEV